MTALNEQSSKKQGSKYQVLGIGTPIVDYLINVSDDYISSLSGVRGGSILVDYPTLQKILQDHPSVPKIIAGGSAANTIKGLIQLEHSSAFIGKIGIDQAGKKFSESIGAAGVVTHFSFSDLPTAQVACLITPDSERTMRTFIGAGAEMNENDLTPELFEGVNLVHIEGYLINRPGVVEKAMKLAKSSGAKVSFDLSSFELVEEYKKSMSELISNFVDIVFANGEEAKALTGLAPENACLMLRDLSEIAVVKMGSEGCWAATASTKAFHEAFEINPVDATGAGDLFASGFLHGFLSGKTLEESMHYGSFIASQVVQTLGAELSQDKWSFIKKSL